MAKLSGPIGFLLGTTFGGIGTYLYLKRQENLQLMEEIDKVRDEYSERIDSLKSVIEEYKKTLKETEKELEDLKGQINDIHNKAIEDTRRELAEKKAVSGNGAPKKIKDKPDPEDIIKQKEDYTKYANKFASSEEKRPEPDVEVGKKKPKKEPYIVQSKDFFEDNGNDKQNITYFRNDDIFIDEDGNVINGCGKLIGKANVNKLINESDGELFIRNEDLETDFDVILEEQPYADYVGISDDDDGEED